MVARDQPTLLGGFTPSALATVPGEALTTTFLNEADWTPTTASVTQDGSQAHLTVTGPGDLDRAATQVARFLSLDVDATVELGLQLEGRTTVEGDWDDRCVGLDGVRCEIAVVKTPDGHGRLELMQFLSPDAVDGAIGAPPNAFGLRRIAFAVDDLDAAVERLRARDAEFLGDVVQYEDAYKLCYVRGPEGIILMLAEALD